MHSIQIFGGRGATYSAPSDNSNPNYGISLGSKVSDTLKGAIGTKGKAINMEKSYKDANPNYDKTGSYASYNQNCQRCVVAYELRRRGYDVTALPTYEGDTLPIARLRGNVKWGTWQGAFKNAKPESVKGKTSQEVVNNISAKMKGYGGGSRGVVSITYSGKRTGHVFNVENRSGKTYFVDAQSGKRLWAKNFIDNADKSTVTLVRTDNLRISERAKNFVTSENIYKRR